jgi:hypothetical protein
MEILKGTVVIFCLLFMFSLCFVLIKRNKITEKENESGYSTHRRTVQLVAVWLFVPGVIILYTFGLDSNILGTLLGAFLGYVLAEVGKS